MSMQMEAYLKKEQIGTLFVRVGALEGGFGGWEVGLGVHPKNNTCFLHNFFPASCIGLDNSVCNSGVNLGI